MMRPSRRIFPSAGRARCIAMALLVGTIGAASLALAQAPAPSTTEPKPAEATPTQPAPTRPPAPPPVPSLDDLLGTPKPATTEPNPATATTPPADLTDPARSDLDRLLDAAEIGEAFTQAVNLMGDAAKRLETGRDPGLTTQRVQEDVIRRLDQLLASMQQQQSSSSSSSSSSSQSQESQSQRSQPSQKRPQAGRGQQTPSQGGDGQTEGMGPPRQDGQLRPALDAARAAWGGLPDRVREMLLQGSNDRFSAKYQAMTEAYYRRLAEEKK